MIKSSRGKRVTLPRQRPTPEPNTVQRPELIRRLSKRLGVRQAHILPGLAEGIQAVVLLDDLTTHNSDNVFRNYFQWQGPATPTAGTHLAGCYLLNPSTSKVDVRPRSVVVSHNTTDTATGLPTTARIDLWDVPENATFTKLGATQGSVAQKLNGGRSTGSANAHGVQVAIAALAAFNPAAVVELQSGVPFNWPLAEQQFVIPPGRALLCTSEEFAVVGRLTDELFVTWFWEEEEGY